MAEAKRAGLGLETDDPSVFRFARQQYASSVERERIISGTLFLLVSSVVLTYVVLSVSKKKREGLFDFGGGRGGFDVVPVVVLAFPLFSLGVYAAIGWKGKVSTSGYLLLLSVLVFGAVALTDALLNREDKTLPVIYGVGFGVLVVAAYVLWWRGQARALVERNREFQQRLAEGGGSQEQRGGGEVEEQPAGVLSPLKALEAELAPAFEAPIPETGTEKERVRHITDALTKIEKALSTRRQTPKEERTHEDWIELLRLKSAFVKKLDDALGSKKSEHIRAAIKAAGDEAVRYYDGLRRQQKAASRRRLAKGGRGGGGRRQWKQGLER